MLLEVGSLHDSSFRGSIQVSEGHLCQCMATQANELDAQLRHRSR